MKNLTVFLTLSLAILTACTKSDNIQPAPTPPPIPHNYYSTPVTATLNGQQYVYSQTPEGIVTIKYPDGHIQTLPDISISQLFVINTGGTLMLFALSPGDSNGGWPHYILLGSNTWIHLHAFYWVPTGDGRNYFVPATQIMSVSPLGSSGWTLKVADYLGSFWCTDTVKNVWLECN